MTLGSEPGVSAGRGIRRRRRVLLLLVVAAAVAGAALIANFAPLERPFAWGVELSLGAVAIAAGWGARAMVGWRRRILRWPLVVVVATVAALAVAGLTVWLVEVHVPRLRLGARVIGFVAPEFLGGAMTELPWEDVGPQAWEADLDALVYELPRRHPGIATGGLPEAFTRVERRLRAELPSVPPREIPLRFAALVATLNDAHSRIPLVQPAVASRALPLEMYLFDEGLFVLGAPAQYRRAIGGRVLRIGTVPVERVLRRVRLLVSAEHESWRRLNAARYVRVVDVLQWVGAMRDEGDVELLLAKPDGEKLRVAVTPAAPIQEVMGLHRRAAKGDFARLTSDGDRVVVRIDQLRRDGEGGGWQGLVERLAATLAARQPQRVVVDLRQCDGGDNRLAEPLVEVLRKRGGGAGTLYVLIGRNTFSACANLATALEARTPALMVGEPSGNAPNQFGDATPLVLPHSRLLVMISSRYWQWGVPNDPRPAIVPDLLLSSRAADHFAGRDAQLAAALAHRPAPPSQGRSGPTSCGGSFQFGPLLRFDLQPRKQGIGIEGTDVERLLAARFIDTGEATLAGEVPGRRLQCPTDGRPPLLMWEGATLQLERLPETAPPPVPRLLGDAHAAARLRSILKGAPYRLDSRLELGVNTAGYRLLARGRKREAADLMALNAELFPTSANAWDSLGEALLAAGDAAAARCAYEKALALASDMPSARAALEGAQLSAVRARCNQLAPRSAR